MVSLKLKLSLKWWQSSILWSVLYSFHSLYHCSHSVSLITIRCHSLSLAVTLCHSLYHSLSLVVSLAVIRCHLLYHSLSFVVTRCITRCHSLSFVITRCTTRLSFYKRSKETLAQVNRNLIHGDSYTFWKSIEVFSIK